MAVPTGPLAEQGKAFSPFFWEESNKLSVCGRQPKLTECVLVKTGLNSPIPSMQCSSVRLLSLLCNVLHCFFLCATNKIATNTFISHKINTGSNQILSHQLLRKQIKSTVLHLLSFLWEGNLTSKWGNPPPHPPPQYAIQRIRKQIRNAAIYLAIKKKLQGKIARL